MTTKQTAKAKTKKKIPMPPGLWNWPPSRGPKPDVLRAKPTYVVPDVVVEKVPLKPHRQGHHFAEPSVPIARVIPTPLKKRKVSRGRRRARLWDDVREIDVSVWGQLVEVGKLRPSQWDLVIGAWASPTTRLRGPGGKPIVKKVPHVNLETRLPTRTLTVDLRYPLSTCARVTIRPYRIRWGRSARGGHEGMTVGYALWAIARAYRQIYRQWRTYGVWGHAIEDLHFARLSVSDNIVTVGIDS